MGSCEHGRVSLEVHLCLRQPKSYTLLPCETKTAIMSNEMVHVLVRRVPSVFKKWEELDISSFEW